MAGQDFAIHYVCTHEEAHLLAFQHSRFWVSNCGCREGRGRCDQSRLDVCLMFRGDIQASGSGIKEIGLTEVLALFEEAFQKRLVARPYRNKKDRNITDGICFCCGDCCEYFTNPDINKCDKGSRIAYTDMEKCNFCGECIDACYFDGRSMRDGEIVLNDENCYGCGLCADACLEKCVTMIAR